MRVSVTGSVSQQRCTLSELVRQVAFNLKGIEGQACNVDPDASRLEKSSRLNSLFRHRPQPIMSCLTTHRQIPHMLLPGVHWG
jgi:hypothetical protein